MPERGRGASGERPSILNPTTGNTTNDTERNEASSEHQSELDSEREGQEREELGFIVEHAHAFLLAPSSFWSNYTKP